jgi:hypothetical protein
VAPGVGAASDATTAETETGANPSGTRKPARRDAAAARRHYELLALAPRGDRSVSVHERRRGHAAVLYLIASGKSDFSLADGFASAQ